MFQNILHVQVCVTLYIIQIMNGYECDGTDFFMRLKMECSIERGEAKLNRAFHLSLNLNICTIARMKNIHFLFQITPLFIFVIYNAILMYTDLKILENAKSVLIVPSSGQRSPQCTIEGCTVLLHGIIKPWRHMRAMVCLFYIM